MEPALTLDIELEQAILGAIIIDNAKIDIAAAIISPEHFSEPLHARIFELMSMLHEDGTVTPLLLHSVMKTNKALKELGGLDYLVNLIKATPALFQMRDHARRLRELAVRRELVAIGQDIAEQATTGTDTTAKQVGAAVRAVDLVAARLENRETQLSATAVASEVMALAEKASAGMPVLGVPTGLKGLDDEVGKLHGSDLIVVAGRSGMGKSALLGGMAVRAALAGYPTLVFSLEMKRTQWIERTICDLDFDTAPKPMWYSHFRNHRLNGEEVGRAAQVAYDRLGPSLPMEICDDDALTIHQIASRARAFKAQHGKLGLIVLDYLQIVEPAERRDRSREQEVTAIVRGAKSMAKSLDWPVIAGAQLLTKGGDVHAAKDRRPTVADIRESGAIEFEADLIFAPYRKAFYVGQRKPEAGPGSPEWASWKAEIDACIHKFELLVLKNRHGRTCELDLYCDMAASAIRDFEPYRPSESERNGDLLARVA